jgi:hypothetical protein
VISKDRERVEERERWRIVKRREGRRYKAREKVREVR